MNFYKQKLKVRERKNLLQICIPTSGCKLGKCIFCNYGKSELLPLKDILYYIKNILDKYTEKTVLLINAIGSILDEKEIPQYYLDEILKLVNSYKNIKYIILETHYLTINDEICKKIRKIFKDKEVSIEIGIETSNPNSMKHIHKFINLKLLEEKVKIMHKYNFNIEGNVFLGIPYLSIDERINDSVQTIHDSLNVGIDEIVLFPCNLKKETELMALYDDGKYEKVSHFEMLECLERLDEETLKKISFSWYGDWIQTDDNDVVINEFPLLSTKVITKQEEKILSELWMNFYSDFVISKDKKETLRKYDILLSKYK